MKAEYAIPAGWAKVPLRSKLKAGDRFLYHGNWEETEETGRATMDSELYIRKQTTEIRNYITISLGCSADAKVFTVQRDAICVDGTLDTQIMRFDNPMEACASMVKCAQNLSGSVDVCLVSVMKEKLKP